MSDFQTELNSMALRSLMPYQGVKSNGDISNIKNADMGTGNYAVELVAQGQKREADRNEQMASDMQKILVLSNLLSGQVEKLAEGTKEQEKRLSSLEKEIKKVKENVKKQRRQQSVQGKNISALLRKQKNHKKDLKVVKECLSMIGVAMNISNYGASIKSIKNNMEQRLSLPCHEKHNKIPKLKYEELGES